MHPCRRGIEANGDLMDHPGQERRFIWKQLMAGSLLAAIVQIVLMNALQR
jgi:hypothetical protein